jgi:WD40 repeat protein
MIMKPGLISVAVILAILVIGGVVGQETDYELMWSVQTQGRVKNVAISDNGDYIAAGSNDYSVYLFDREGNRLWDYDASGEVNSVSVSSEGSYTAAGTGTEDSRVYLFDKIGQVLWAHHLARKGVSLVKVTDDGTHVAAATENPDNTLYYFYSDGRKALKTFLWSEKIGGIINGLAVSADGSIVVVGSLDSNVYLFSRDGDLLESHDIGNDPVTSVAISDDGSYVVAGDQNNNVLLLQIIYPYKEVIHTIARSKLLWSRQIDHDLFHVSFLSNSSTVAVQGRDLNIAGQLVSKDNVIYLFSLEGELLKKSRIETPIGRMSFSEDGSSIAAASEQIHDALYFFSEVTQVTPPPPRSSIIVLANSIDYGLAADFISFLKNKGFEVTHTTASNFNEYKDEGFIVILGGPDSPEGVGEIVQEVLTTTSENTIRESGASKMLVKTNLWREDQSINVLAGFDRELTRQAHRNNRDRVVSSINP